PSKTTEQASGQKKDDGTSGQRSEKAQPQGNAEPRMENPRGSQDQAKTADPERRDQTGPSQGERPSPKATDRDRPKPDAQGGAAKAQDKSATQKSNAGERGTANAADKKSQDAAAHGAKGSDKTEEKGSAGQGEGQQDRTQPPKSDRSGTAPSGDKSQNDISKLSEALKNQDANTRASARKRLEELRDKGADPAQRQAAADSL